jgi:hypothetical protein
VFFSPTRYFFGVAGGGVAVFFVVVVGAGAGVVVVVVESVPMVGVVAPGVEPMPELFGVALVPVPLDVEPVLEPLTPVGVGVVPMPEPVPIPTPVVLPEPVLLPGIGAVLGTTLGGGSAIVPDVDSGALAYGWCERLHAIVVRPSAVRMTRLFMVVELRWGHVGYATGVVVDRTASASKRAEPLCTRCARLRGTVHRADNETESADPLSAPPSGVKPNGFATTAAELRRSSTR